MKSKLEMEMDKKYGKKTSEVFPGQEKEAEEIMEGRTTIVMDQTDELSVEEWKKLQDTFGCKYCCDTGFCESMTAEGANVVFGVRECSHCSTTTKDRKEFDRIRGMIPYHLR